MKKKLLATFEVIGILAIGWTLTRVLTAAFNVPSLQEHLDEAVLSENPRFLYLAGVGFLTLLIQFLCLMVPAYLLTRLLHKKGPRSFGITKGSVPLKENLLAGVVVFCLLGIPMKLLLIANHFADLGTVPSYWELFNKDWNFGFWIFMAVGSYAVIPIFEELFYRGYAQFRLEKAFGFFSVLLISLLFTLVHLQYFIADGFNIGMLFSLFTLALGMAFLRHLHVSILAPIIIHSLMNIPLKYPYDVFVLAMMVLVLVLQRKRVVQLATSAIHELRNVAVASNLLFLMIVVAFAFGMNSAPEVTLVVSVSLFVISLATQVWHKRKLKSASKKVVDG